MANQLTPLDRSFHALGDPTRFAIVARLCERDGASVSEIAAPFRMALPSLMKHLAVLEAAGLIRTAKTGRVRTCHLRVETMSAIADWIADRRALWEGRFDRLDAYLSVTDPTEKE